MSIDHWMMFSTFAEQDFFHGGEKLTRYRTLDDPMIIGGGQRQNLRDPEIIQPLRVGAGVLRWVANRANPDDRALTVHQARHRVNRDRFVS